jgi:ATP-dependent Clp protease ATP-binding subunit ClpC
MDTIRVAERCQRALRFGFAEAKRQQAPEVTPDHVLLGLLEDGAGEIGPGVVTEVLKTLRIEKEPISDALRSPDASNDAGRDSQIGYGSEMRNVLERATSEAKAFGHAWVGAEHLFLGIVQSQSRGADLLAAAGLTADRARMEIRRALHGPAA